MTSERADNSSNGDVFIGWAIGVSNKELGLDVFGSPHEVLNTLKAQGHRLYDVAKHKASEITKTEIFGSATDIPEISDVPGLRPVVEGILAGDLEKVMRALGLAPSLFSSPHGAGIPLAMAAFLGQADIVKLFIEHGSPVGQSLSLGMTPLHWAGAAGQRDVVEFLLDAGAEVAMNWFLLTPDQLAFRNGHRELAGWIEQKIPDSWKELGFDDIMLLVMSEPFEFPCG